VQQKIARDFEKKVAPEKDAEKQAKLRTRDPESGVHGQCGEADVDAVEIGNHIQQEQQRDQPPAELADDRRSGVNTDLWIQGCR